MFSRTIRRHVLLSSLNADSRITAQSGRIGSRFVAVLRITKLEVGTAVDVEATAEIIRVGRDRAPPLPPPPPPGGRPDVFSASLSWETAF